MLYTESGHSHPCNEIAEGLPSPTTLVPCLLSHPRHLPPIGPPMAPSETFARTAGKESKFQLEHRQTSAV